MRRSLFLLSALYCCLATGGLFAASHFRDYYAPVTESEHADIRFVIVTCANSNELRLMSQEGSIRRVGQRFDHVHPLKWLEHVFTDEELKVGMRNIRKKTTFVWPKFSHDLRQNLNDEANRGNITDEMVADFAKNVGLDLRCIAPAVKARRWDDFLQILLTRIPRQGNYDRYRGF